MLGDEKSRAVASSRLRVDSKSRESRVCGRKKTLPVAMTHMFAKMKTGKAHELFLLHLPSDATRLRKSHYLSVMSRCWFSLGRRGSEGRHFMHKGHNSLRLKLQPEPTPVVQSVLFHLYLIVLFQVENGLKISKCIHF